MANYSHLLRKPIEIYLHRFGKKQYTFDGVITSVRNRKKVVIWMYL